METLAANGVEIRDAIAAVLQALQSQLQGQQIVSSSVQKAVNVYNAPVTIQKQDISL